VRDPLTGTWYWNPEAHAYTGLAACRPIPQGELVTFVAPYHIDYPAMTIYLRSAVGEQGWARFVERFGIPPVILTMPSDIPSDQVETWRASAEKVAEGGSGAVPAGTAVNFCDGARGINPFKDFIKNQRELIVLMSTGGLLTSLTESGSGTLAGGAHSDTWAEVRRMDSAKIGSVINRTLADAILDRAFPGRPHLAYFAFDTEAVPSPGEVFDDAAKAKASGYLIDKADLEERTGYRLVKDESTVSAPVGSPFMNREKGQRSKVKGHEEGQRSKVKGQTVEDNLHCLTSDLEPLTSSMTSDLEPRTSSVLSAFAKDTGPAADAIKELLKNPSKEAAEKLLADLPTLLPDDPALAAVIAEEMAKQFSVDGRDLTQAATLENEVQRVPSGNGNGGQFTGATNQPDGVIPRNDGKIDFHGREKSKQKADKQCRDLGYKSVEDMMHQSTTVEQKKIDVIVQGGDFTCKPHEAVAALRSLKTIDPNVDGEEPVKLNERSVRHYVCGDRRGGEPDIKRLIEFPRAVDAVRHSTSHHWELDDVPISRIDKEPLPEFSQTVYEKSFGSGKAKVYAYTDNGVLNGWQLNP